MTELVRAGSPRVGGPDSPTAQLTQLCPSDATPKTVSSLEEEDFSEETALPNRS